MQRTQESGVLCPAASTSQHADRPDAQTSPDFSRPTHFAWPVLLDTALDSAAMTTYLRSRLTPLADCRREFHMTEITLLDCKPGQRGLIRYEVTPTEGTRPIVIFGKVYADPTQLARVAQVLHTLHHDLFRAHVECGVPQPLGVIPELSMLLYVPAEGRFLDEVLVGAPATDAVQMTARWLGALHSHPLQVDKHFQLTNELTNLATWVTLVSQTYPELSTLARRALWHLQEQALRLSFATSTTIHKDFHYRHVLVARGVKVIDFDELRLGDPNFDLAHFCANLQLLSYRQHGSPHHLRDLETRFLNAYACQTGWGLVRQRERFIFFYVYTCLKLARQLTLGFGPGPAPTGAERRRQVQMVLDQAVDAVSAVTDRSRWD